MSSCSWSRMDSLMPCWAAARALFAAVLVLAGGVMVTVSRVQAQAASSLVGTWLVEEKDGIFSIAPCPSDASRLCGWLVGMDYTEAEPEKDVWGRSECGLEIISNMKRRKNGQWHGTILDPRSGRTYQAIMWQGKGDTLKLRGYVGLSLFGETQTWSRIAAPVIGRQCRMKIN